MVLMPTPGPWAAHSLLGGVNADDREALLRMGRIRRCTPGEFLIRSGEQIRDAFILISGYAKIVAYTADGRTVLLAVRMPGDVVGEITTLYGGLRTATVQIATRSEVCVIEHQRFRMALESHPGLAEAVNRGIAEKLREATEIRVDVSGASTIVKVAAVIRQLAARGGHPIAGESVDERGSVVEAPMSQSDLAALAGVGHSSVERTLAKLRQLKLVDWQRRAITIRDVAALDAFVASGGDPHG